MAAAVIALVLSFGLLLAVLTDQGRRPTRVVDTMVVEQTSEIMLYVDTCLGDPEVEVLVEDDARVVISVDSDVQTGPGPGCLDAVPLRLRQPLGDRVLVDDVTGRPIWVPPAGRA